MLTDTEILKEIEGIQYLYGLKRVIRYHHTREEEFDTESVAEHVYAMNVLARYFLPLEDPESKWDHAKIYEMILWHDIDEIETGDMIGYLKTEEDRANEAVAAVRVIEHIPDSMRERVRLVRAEYDAQETIEARFAKAIDRIEPSFHLLSENGKRVMSANRETMAQHKSLKIPIAPFPIMERFNNLLTDEMIRRDFFHE